MRLPSMSFSGWSRVGRGRGVASDAWTYYVPRHVQWRVRKGTFFAVADSVGRGTEIGQVSRRAVEVALRAYYMDPDANANASLTRAVQQANEALLRMPPGTADGLNGSALSAVVVFDHHVSVANVGDARVFLVRPPHMWALTTDHSWLSEHGAGPMSPAQLRSHPRRWDLSRALGRNRALNVDVRDVRIQPGDTLVLCSDGVTDMLPPGEIGAVAGLADNANSANTLVERAGLAGADDSATCVVVRIQPAHYVQTPRRMPSMRSAYRLTPPGGVRGRRADRPSAMVLGAAAALTLIAIVMLAALG